MVTATDDLRTVASEGGVTLALPGSWRPARTLEHGTVFTADRGHAGVVPTAVLEVHEGHVRPDDWWADQAAALPGALLLAAADDGAGFRARWAHVADGRSLTGHARARHVPGRTVLLTLVHATASLEVLAPVADRVLDSLDVQGLP